ncbi:MAG: TldD/PmbA family protein [Acidobacteria bacterium]|nr:MAG: TldD/PmbA family protein [Acidobacteriota bacterium]
MSRHETVDEQVLEVVGTLAAEGWPAVEVHWKRGRSRTLRYDPHHQVSCLRREEGWAVRAGDERRSFFFAASGPPRPDAPWPAADGGGLRLPPAQPVPSWTLPADVDEPILGENEAVALVRGIERALDTELPGARLLGAELEDGSSESQLGSSRGVRARFRQRSAHLHLEAIGPDGPVAGSVALETVARAARRFHPVALARRLADRLAVALRGSSPPRDRGELLLAPAVTCQLLAALGPLWIGPEAEARTAALGDQGGRIAGGAVTVIDDGRMAGGILESPVDGEGVPTRPVRLVEAGRLRQPLLAWWQSPEELHRASGCSLRPGWRDLPRPGPTHLYLEPDGDAAVTDLLAGVARGYYLLDVEGRPDVALERDRFALPVCGFRIERGRAAGALSGARLTGAVSAFLHGIVAVARDLTFQPLSGGMIGAPSVLVRGLELRRRN